jgi:hypothetical protein
MALPEKLQLLVKRLEDGYPFPLSSMKNKLLSLDEFRLSLQKILPERIFERLRLGIYREIIVYDLVSGSSGGVTTKPITQMKKVLFPMSILTGSEQLEQHAEFFMMGFLMVVETELFGPDGFDDMFLAVEEDLEWFQNKMKPKIWTDGWNIPDDIPKQAHGTVGEYIYENNGQQGYQERDEIAYTAQLDDKRRKWDDELYELAVNIEDMVTDMLSDSKTGSLKDRAEVLKIDIADMIDAYVSTHSRSRKGKEKA